MTKQFEYLSSDIVGHLAFGYPLRMQTEDTNRSLLSAVPFGGKRANIYMQFPRSAVIEPLLRLVGRAAGNKYRAIISKMIEHRVALSKDALHDLYSFAADSKLDGKGMEGDELWAEAFFFIVAGGATTATTMSSLCFYLVRYPECYKKLSQEIRSQFQSGEEIRSGHQLQGCSYLRACIDEALRMSPPSSGMLWRKQAPSKTGEKPNNASFIVDGHVIPYGTEVTVNTYALHHNEAYFPDSFAFRPERWLTPEGKDPSSLIRKAFVPFSMGTRSCVGKALAYLEISLALANISYYFDFEQAPGNQGQVGGGVKGRRDGREREDEFQLYDILTALHDGPVLMFKERKAVRGDL
jgi:cytochrome P450